MKKKEIQPLPFVKQFSDYFAQKAKRVLKLKDSEFEDLSIDVNPKRGTIRIWFYGPEKVIGTVRFKLDGRYYEKSDNRKEK